MATNNNAQTADVEFVTGGVHNMTIDCHDSNAPLLDDDDDLFSDKELMIDESQTRAEPSKPAIPAPAPAIQTRSGSHAYGELAVRHYVAERAADNANFSLPMPELPNPVDGLVAPFQGLSTAGSGYEHARNRAEALLRDIDELVETLKLQLAKAEKEYGPLTDELQIRLMLGGDNCQTTAAALQQAITLGDEGYHNGVLEAQYAHAKGHLDALQAISLEISNFYTSRLPLKDVEVIKEYLPLEEVLSPAGVEAMFAIFEENHDVARCYFKIIDKLSGKMRVAHIEKWLKEKGGYRGEKLEKLFFEEVWMEIAHWEEDGFRRRRSFKGEGAN